MQRSFLRCHILAWMAAVVFACIGTFALSLTPPNLLLNRPFMALPQLAIYSGIAILFAWRVAVLLGAYDILAFLLAATALALAFGASYSMDVHSFLPDDGHTFFDVMTFGARPFDVLGEGRIFLVMLLWTAGTVGCGMALKHFLETRTAAPARESRESIDLAKTGGWLAADILVVACITGLILRIEVVNRVTEGKPENICHTAQQVLHSPTSTETERGIALFNVSRVSGDEATAILRQAAFEQSPPLRLAAAADLLGRDDMLALSLLQKTLDQSSSLQGSVSSKTSGPLVSSQTGISYQFNLGSMLRSVKDPAALPILIHLLDSTDPEIRLGAIEGIRNFKTPEIIDPLIKGLDDPDPRVRRSSEWGLELFLLRDQAKYGWHPPHYDSPATEHQAYIDSLTAWVKEWQSRTLGQ